MPAGCDAPPFLIHDDPAPDNLVALYATGCGDRAVAHTFTEAGR